MSHSFPHVPSPSRRPRTRVPAPTTGSPVPEPRGVPAFDPLRSRGSRLRLRRAVLRQRRATAAGLAVTAAALAAAGAGGAVGAAGAGSSTDTGAGASPDAAATARSGRDPARGEVDLVSAPVRIADAATVRLLRRGDRVDVIAAPPLSPGSLGSPERESEARVVARGARVSEIPRAAENGTDGGALVVLSVPRKTAAQLAGASATSRLAVTVC
ncbi:hypothetical protein [Streptomyces sp. NRRL F-5135]|uniref:hypothetical protein n=1 Tax=Streptomyces sp. NRRL F-5135 TaxID=1463858 RepID=UPI000D13F28A